VPDDIARWKARRENLQKLLSDMEGGPLRVDATTTGQLRELISALDEHIAALGDAAVELGWKRGRRDPFHAGT
jgi:hypothetical protein